MRYENRSGGKRQHEIENVIQFKLSMAHAGHRLVKYNIYEERKENT
jgi:hypothetical protein